MYDYFFQSSPFSHPSYTAYHPQNPLLSNLAALSPVKVRKSLLSLTFLVSGV